MDKKQTVCRAERIEQFLADQLSDDEQADFEDHLDACDACRLELERQAAEPAVWREVREWLSSSRIDAPAMDAGPLEKAEAETSGSHGFPGAPGGQGDSLRLDAVLRCLAPTDDPRMLGRLGGYEIAGVIGHGGMGVVLKGFDAALNRYVAIKVLAPHLAASGSARRRFAREAQAAAAVVHENVVAIHGVADASSLPYFVMPYVRGTSLQKRLDERGPLGVTEILRIAMQTASGLAAAHAQGLVHRDIKPANILLADGVERVKITDFGLARAADDASLTRTGVIAGTPQFMSPEQARGESVDACSDLFSLGSVMYAMCTGRPPFRAETSYGILRRITDTEPRPIREINPEIPEWLVAIISKLHAKDPRERFQSSEELAQLLEPCLAHVQQPTAVPLPESVQSLAGQAFPSAETSTSAFEGRLGRIRRTVRRPRTLLAGGILASVLAIVTIAGMAIRHRGPERGTPFRSSAVAVPARPHSGPHPDSASAPWRDGAAEQILKLEQSVQRLEVKAARFWGDQPSSSESDSPTNRIRPIDRESKK